MGLPGLRSFPAPPLAAQHSLFPGEGHLDASGAHSTAQSQIPRTLGVQSHGFGVETLQNPPSLEWGNWNWWALEEAPQGIVTIPRLHSRAPGVLGQHSEGFTGWNFWHVSAGTGIEQDDPSSSGYSMIL